MNKNIIWTIAAVIIIAGGVFFAINSSSSETSDTVSNSSSSQSNEVTRKGLEGNELIQAILDEVKTSTPTVQEVRIIDESNDSNNLIGKTGEYQFAGSFYDTRTDYRPVDDNFDSIDISEDNYKTTAGGSIEIFNSNNDAEKRGELLGQFQTGLINAGPYRVIDNVVLRASENYTASQQQSMLDIMETVLKSN